jgi:hypothetical protein
MIQWRCNQKRGILLLWIGKTSQKQEREIAVKAGGDWEGTQGNPS